MRHLSEYFLNALRSGTLRPVLERVHRDNNLDLELRGKEVTVYYKGLRLLSIKEKSGCFEWSVIDNQYNINHISLPDIDCSCMNLSHLAEYINQSKMLIDHYHEKESCEREIQQMVIKENNYSANSNDTDFFIIDMEYQVGKARFDLIALKWDSTPVSRKGNAVQLYIIEVKQGKDAIRNDSGLQKHYTDYHKFITSNLVEDFKKDMITVFKQKLKLGLITMTGNAYKNKEFVVDDRIEMAIILANYKTASQQLRNELESFQYKDELKFMTSSFMGYGLYSNFIKSADDILCICK